MSVFGGRGRLHGFQCSAQLLRLKRAGAVRGRALQLFQQGNGSEAVQAAAVDQLHARCGKNGKDLDLRCIQLGQKRRKSCLLRGPIRQGRVDRLGRLIQLLCPVGGFSVIGKGTAITITFQADDTMLRDEHERKIGFGLAVRELAGHDDVPVIFAHRYIKRIAEAGADIIYIHPESELIPSATLELIQLEGKKTGLILNPCTSLETVKDMLPITDYVMIMAVNPGFAGREFMPYTRQKFIELDNYRKEKGLNYHLMLDGGATREVIADLYHNCNVEGFVLGKQELFFQQDDYATCIDRIRTF